MKPAKAVAIAMVVAVLAIGWFGFGPSRLGGGADYVTTNGNSMEPRFHTGDLAVIRPAADYRTGDVVAYRSATIDTVVMHRIVAVDGDRFTFRGDNNSWIDPDRPATDELVGKLALRIPQGGAWLDRLTSPTGLAVIAFVLLVSTGIATQTRRNRRHRRRGTMSQHLTRRARPTHVLTTLSPTLRAMAGAVGAIGTVGVVLATLTLTGPFAGVDAGAPASRSMTFSYTADVGKTPAYDDTTVTSPDPVFRKVAKSVVVHYAYEGTPGSVAVDAELSTPSGWHTTVSLKDPQTFTSSTFDDTVRLDLRKIDARAVAAAAATGLPAEPVTVSVTPRVTSDGTGPFTPTLRMTLSPLTLTLAGNEALRVEDSAPRPAAKAHSLDLLGQHIPVAGARTLSAALVLLALLAAGILGLVAHHTAPTNEGEAIRRRYAALIVPVNPITAPTSRPVVDVHDFATLARLAGRYGLLVLCWSRSGVDTFIVQDDATSYRFRAGAESSPQDVGSYENSPT